MLNCRAGDLAIIVGKAHAPSLGMIVRCIRLIPPTELRVYDGCKFRATKPTWQLDRFVPTIHKPSGKVVMVDARVDATMRPLRDVEGEDETLSWVKIKEEA